MPKRKILIVEDDKMLCTIFEMFLKELGHELVGIAQTGQTAIELCKKNIPDIILMDIHLAGDIDGIETTKQIQKYYKIPIVYVTSDTENETLKSSIAENTYGFIVKPVYKSTLSATIEFAFYKFEFDKNNNPQLEECI